MFPLLAPEHREALTDFQTWADNPFLRREARRDRKKHQPARSFAWMCGTLLILGGAGLWVLSLMAAYGWGNTWILGGDLGAALCILLCGIHIYYVVGASQKHTLRMVAEEISRNTFPYLMLLPASRFELLLQSMVYPWLAGMRAALVLLPLYALCVGLGGVSWGDILMLYVVFAFSAVSVPRWNRPALHEDVATSTPTAEPTALVARGGAAANNPNAANQNNSFGQWTAMACILFLFAFIFNGARLGAVHNFIHRYAPESLFVLLPTSFLSWPLLLARGLVTPFDWYGVPLPPLPFVLMVFLLNRYTQLVKVSEWLQVGRYRDLATLPTYLPRRRLERQLQISQIYVVIGYLWAWAVRDGALTLLVGRAGGKGAPGLIGLAYLFLIATVYFSGLGRAGALAAWRRAEWETRDRLATPRYTVSSALRYLGTPFLLGPSLYLLCCLTARVYPFPPGLAPLAGRMLAVGAAGMLMRYGVQRVSSLGFLLGLLLPPLALGLYQAHSQLHIPLSVIHHLTYLSPFLGMVNLGSPVALGSFGFGVNLLLSPSLPWQNWVLYCGVAGAVLLLPAWLETRLRRARRNLPPTSDARHPTSAPEGLSPTPDAQRSTPASENTADTAFIDPTLAGVEVFADAPTARKRDADRTDSPAAKRLIAGVQRLTDNAIVIRELRMRLRGRLTPTALQRALIVLLVVTLGLYFMIPIVPETLGVGVAQAFLNHADPETARAVGILLIGYVVLIILSPFSGIGIFPHIFAVEQEKSTLGFTLTTPMSTTAIALGKAIGLLIASGLTVAGLSLWMLLLSLLFLHWIGPGFAFIAWGMVTLSALTLHITLGLIALAVATLFPRRLSARVSGVMRVLLIYIVIFGSQGMRWVLSWVQSELGLSPLGIWLLWLVVSIVIGLISLLISFWRIGRLRRTDFFETTTQRSN